MPPDPTGVRALAASLGWPELDLSGCVFVPAGPTCQNRWLVARLRRSHLGDRDARRALALVTAALRRLLQARREQEARERAAHLEAERRKIERAERRLRDKLEEEIARSRDSTIPDPEPPIIGSRAWLLWRNRRRALQAVADVV